MEWFARFGSLKYIFDLEFSKEKGKEIKEDNKHSRFQILEGKEFKFLKQIKKENHSIKDDFVRKNSNAFDFANHACNSNAIQNESYKAKIGFKSKKDQLH